MPVAIEADEIRNSPYLKSPMRGNSHGHTVEEMARYYNRNPRTINNWIRNGTLISVGCIVMRDSCGDWRIIPPEEQ